MLNVMRKHASSWAVRVLLGVLIVSFAVWGIGDVFLGAGNRTTVAEVGDLEVDLATVNRGFEARYRQLNNALGGAIDRQGALAFGVLDQAVQAAVAERLVDAHTTELGLGVADTEVRDEIQNNPNFRGLGGFDRQSFEFFLRSVGLTEKDFIEQTRNEIRRRALLVTMTSDLAVSSTVTEKLHAFRGERRSGTALIVEASAMQADEPDEETLQSYLEENQTDYEAPEYRSGKAIVLEAEDLVDQIEIGEEQLRQAYEIRAEEFSTPEERELGQLLAPDRETADKLVEALAEGVDFASAAEQFAAEGVSYSKIGPVTPGDLPNALSGAAFTVADGAVSDPVASDFGFHVFKPIRITPGSQQSFEEVEDIIRDELALSEARRQLPDLAARLDDEIAAGESLEAAAEALEVTLIDVPLVSQDGASKDADSAVNMPLEVYRNMFAAEVGETSFLEETENGGYFMYRVDEVEESKPLTLSDVRDDLTSAWQEERRLEASRDLASKLYERVTGGESLEEIQAQEGNRVGLLTIDPTRRNAPGTPPLNRVAIASLFGLEAGQIADSPVEVEGGYALIRLDERTPAEDLDENSESRSAIENEIAQSRIGEILAEYENHLRQRFPVSINQNALEVFYQDPNS